MGREGAREGGGERGRGKVGREEEEGGRGYRVEWKRETEERPTTLINQHNVAVHFHSTEGASLTCSVYIYCNVHVQHNCGFDLVLG